MSWRILVAIGAAGAAGTLLRSGCVALAGSHEGGFPWGTLLVNVLGAFLAGFLYVALRAKAPYLAEYHPVVFVGFLGGFTTFSSFALESAKLLESGAWGLFAANVAAQNASGLLAAVVGMAAARLLFLS